MKKGRLGIIKCQGKRRILKAWQIIGLPPYDFKNLKRKKRGREKVAEFSRQGIGKTA
ncbi:MAG: hypothetical protein Q7R99_04225 [bacterium]|nr:hypothetical protein [bacterium]